MLTNTQICTQIDDLLQEQEQTDKDIVKISLDLDMSKIDEHVLEAIHYKYVVEIIGNDIFIKVSLVLAYATTHSYYLLILLNILV